MSCRVYDCHPETDVFNFAKRDVRGRVLDRGWLAAVVCALLLVPIAGAADQPGGWVAATVGAVLVLALHRLSRGHAPWGPLVWAVGIVAVVVPRTLVPHLGPALFVIGGVSAVVWYASRRAQVPRDDRLPRGSADRDAQEASGRRGEHLVRFKLQQALPPEYVVINGLLIPGGSGDIDHVVVGPTGVFLLETKTMAGHIVCEPDGTWRRTKIGRAGGAYAGFIGDPARQVQRNISAVRACLRERVPNLFQGGALWLEGLVVFAHPRSSLSVDSSRVAAARLDEVVPRICGHQPRRGLDAEEIDYVVAALLAASRERGQVAAVAAQALVEAALALPVVLGLLFGMLALSRIVQAHTAVVGLTHEVARAGALASTPTDALERMQHRAGQVAANFRLRAELLELEPHAAGFGRQNGQVRAVARYRVELGDLPMVGWVSPTMVVRAEHVEWIDPYRSGISSAAGGAE